MSKGSAAAIKKIKLWVGLKEGPEVDRIILKTYNNYFGCNRKSKTWPWCAATIASLFMQLGKLVSGYSRSGACKTQRAYYKKYKRWIPAGNRPQSGDVIFLSGHEGLVTSTSYTGTSYYVSGNSLNKVRTSKFNWKTGKTASGKKILGYGRPKYK
jgi:hypothetical protein